MWLLKCIKDLVSEIPSAVNESESKKLLKSAEKQFFLTFLSFWAKLSYKVILTRSAILGLLVNKLFADDENFRHSRENLPLPI